MAPSSAKKSKKMAIRCWQVPFNRIEWAIVRNLFKSNDPAHLDLVLNLLSMWKTRMGRETPLCVDIADVLIRARKTEATIGEWNWETENQLVLSYSTAVIRFINYVNEMGQKASRQQTVTSISYALKPLGIPDWIINVRHASTHKVMPSIHTLRRAVDFCRAWLWLFYWNRPIEESVQWRQLTVSNESTGASGSGSGATATTSTSAEELEQYPTSDMELVDEVYDSDIDDATDTLDRATSAARASSHPENPHPAQAGSSGMCISDGSSGHTATESAGVYDADEDEDDDDAVFTVDDLKQISVSESGNNNGEAKEVRQKEDSEIVVVEEQESADEWKVAKDWTEVCQLGLTQHQTAESLCLGFGIHKDWSKEEPVPLSLDQYPDVMDDCSSQFPPIIIDEKFNGPS